MVFNAFLAIGIILLLLYVIQILYYALALQGKHLKRETSESGSRLHISLIIPVRNEINNLANLLSDLEDQDYPKDLFEVIFIDDHSSDGSTVFLKEACSSKKNFKFLTLDARSKGKKTALHHGITHARGEWIIQTDADCRIPSAYITLHASKASERDTLMIAGPVLISANASLWTKLEALEYLSLTATAMASFKRQRPVMCSGANLSYNKDFYFSIADQLLESPTPSGDDVFVMLQAKKREKPVSYLHDAKAIVFTRSSGSLRAFLQQRIRWGSKSRIVKDGDILRLSFLVLLTNINLTILLILSLFTHGTIYYFLFFLLVKSMADLMLLLPASGILKQNSLLGYFPLGAIFYYFYVSIAGLFSLSGKYRWKDRKFKM